MYHQSCLCEQAFCTEHVTYRIFMYAPFTITVLLGQPHQAKTYRSHWIHDSSTCCLVSAKRQAWTYTNTHVDYVSRYEVSGSLGEVHVQPDTLCLDATFLFISDECVLDMGSSRGSAPSFFDDHGRRFT